MNTILYKNLQKVKGLVSSPIYKEKLEKNSVNINYFLETLEFYLNNLDVLAKEYKKEDLELVNDELNVIKGYITSSSSEKVITSISIIENYRKEIFKDETILKKEINSEYEIEFAYLDSIKIENYFSIKNIEITNLKDKKEIYFVGENGDGKTILLQAILLALKKEYSGKIIEYIRPIGNKMKLSVKDEFAQEYSIDKNISNIFAYGINRNKVRKKFDKYGYSGLFDTSDFTDTTFLKEPDEILKGNYNYNLVTEFLNKLNQCILQDNITVERKNNELIFKENQKEITFDKLSEGYKSTIIWLCDLVSRLIDNKEENKKVKRLRNFQAIVLIDEVDLYLHPKWKYDFIYNLRLVFPKIQFIMITHSTATILGASKKATFYKVYKENRDTKISQPMSNIKNLMANNLSTSPLFDMETARARNSDNNLDTRDDFISSKIHKIIKERVKGKKAIVEDDIEDMINQELDDFLKENNL